MWGFNGPPSPPDFNNVANEPEAEKLTTNSQDRIIRVSGTHAGRQTPAHGEAFKRKTSKPTRAQRMELTCNYLVYVLDWVS